MKENTTIFQKAITAYGKDNQIEQTIEECAELIVALRHYQRGKDTINHVCEEIADVSIMLEQMAVIFPINTIEFQRVEKLKRLNNNLNKS